jgi:hypothetical protein
VKYILALIVLLTAPALAAYAPEEMCVIPWGNNVDQLKVLEPHYEDSEGGVDYLIPTGGPNQAIVDMNDIIYVSSAIPGYFKGFDLNGNATIDFSPGSQNYNDSLFEGSVQKFYVDSLSRIYFQSRSPRDFIAMADTSGHVLSALNPFGESSNINIEIIGFNSQDIISTLCWYKGYYTYKNGVFMEGGSTAWLARDGNYYDATIQKNRIIKFWKFNNPDLDDKPLNLDTLLVPLLGNSDGFIFLGLDDETNIYLLTTKATTQDYIYDHGIQIYNNQFKLMQEFSFPPTEKNTYMWYKPEPYIRRDGNIYEFRCLDDGLHVIRWSRK